MRLTLSDGAGPCIAAGGSALLLAGFIKTVLEDAFRMRGRPAVGEQPVEVGLIFRGQVQQDVGQVGPRLQPVALGSRDDRTQYGRPLPGLLVAQEQPVLAVMLSSA